MHSTSIDQLPMDQRKALSAFSFGSSGFILAPEMSSEILSCLEDVSDIAGIMRNISISSSSIKFMVDNEFWDVAAWACDASCFANNPTKQIGSGIGELEIIGIAALRRVRDARADRMFDVVATADGALARDTFRPLGVCGLNLAATTAGRAYCRYWAGW